MKRILLLSTIFLISFTAFAQEFPYGQIDYAALDMKKYDKDTSAHAVVLNEYGTSRLHFDADYRVVVTYERHIKIKFFDNKEFDNQGKFEIALYSENQTTYQEAQDIKGITFYKDEQGNVQQAELDAKKVYSVKESQHLTRLKFAMPALRNGCIVEVSYKIISPYLNLPSWHFQSHIPKMNSVYEVHIPGFWSYNASLKGYLKLTSTEAKIEKGCFTYGAAVADCSDLIYGMKDVPAFVEEDYMTSENNYLSSVNFDVTEETDLNNGAKTKYNQDWQSIDYNLRSTTGFGTQLKRKDLMKDRVVPFVITKTEQLEKAKAVYDYIKKTIKWNGVNDWQSYDGIRKALDNHTGNSGDINLALVTALNAVGIPTEAVLLSTRDHGAVNKLFANKSSFDYVIAKANIGDKSYLLDATEPMLPFGMLPIRCLNDQGRVYSLDKPSYWIDLAGQQRENVTYALDLTLEDNGKLKGTIIRYSSGYSGFLKRKEIKTFNSIDEYVENFAGKLLRTKVLKSDIVNIDSLDKPLGETYEVEINPFDDVNHARLAFSPFFNRLTTNPFKLAERNYPVDWGMPSDERYVVNIHLPAQYVIENIPQPISFAMPNQGGKFFTSIDGDNHNLTFSYDTRFDKSVYGPDEYPYLKELYNKIILAQKSELVFKKKSS
jgi:hypothetical protein